MKRFISGLFKDSDQLEGSHIKRRQLTRVLVLSGVAVSALVVGLGFFKEEPKPPSTMAPKPSEPQRLAVASDSVDVRDIWANRIEERAKGAEAKAEQIGALNEMLTKRLESLEEILSHGAVMDQPEGQAYPSGSSGSNVEAPRLSSLPEVVPQQNAFTALPPESFGAPMGETQTLPLETKRKSKILHKKREGSQKLYKNANHYVPAGSYAKAVLTSGVVVSTAVATQSNPQPIILRLADEGNMPRGFFSHLKDAVLIGSCYGDLSAERALCRLHTLSVIEGDGTIVERSIEGWIIGEDGAPGLRGKIVDRAGEVAREAFLSGILSGMSSFLQFDASRSVYPVSPFGQTNAFSAKDAMTGGLGKGTSNALDKLAEFSIKRAEAMQPVIVVNGGRVVDVVFKRGIDLLPDEVPHVKLVSDTPSSTPINSEGTL
jgi:conjugal transfer pilus assembly protein TraB